MAENLCKYCKQDEQGYHEDDCPQTKIHQGYGMMQELCEKYSRAMKALDAACVFCFTERSEAAVFNGCIDSKGPGECMIGNCLKEAEEIWGTELRFAR